MKSKVMVGLILSVEDNLVNTVVEFTDPALPWEALRLQFQSRDASQMNLLSQQLQNITMKDGTDVEKYITKAKDLKNRLTVLGEPISERMLMNLLNWLLCSYEGVIQNLSTLDIVSSFERMSAKLITEHHCMKWRDQ
jgi:hypothetical protein